MRHTLRGAARADDGEFARPHIEADYSLGRREKSLEVGRSVVFVQPCWPLLDYGLGQKLVGGIHVTIRSRIAWQLR